MPSYSRQSNGSSNRDSNRDSHRDSNRTRIRSPEDRRRRSPRRYTEPVYSNGRKRGQKSFKHWADAWQTDEVIRKEQEKVPYEEEIMFIPLPRAIYERVIEVLGVIPLVDSKEFDEFMAEATPDYHDLEEIWASVNVDIETEESKTLKKKRQEEEEKKQQTKREEAREKREQAMLQAIEKLGTRISETPTHATPRNDPYRTPPPQGPQPVHDQPIDPYPVKAHRDPAYNRTTWYQSMRQHAIDTGNHAHQAAIQADERLERDYQLIAITVLENERNDIHGPEALDAANRAIEVTTRYSAAIHQLCQHTTGEVFNVLIDIHQYLQYKTHCFSTTAAKERNWINQPTTTPTANLHFTPPAPTAPLAMRVSATSRGITTSQAPRFETPRVEEDLVDPEATVSEGEETPAEARRKVRVPRNGATDTPDKASRTAAARKASVESRKAVKLAKSASKLTKEKKKSKPAT